jgi:hypothetical protein
MAQNYSDSGLKRPFIRWYADVDAENGVVSDRLLMSYLLGFISWIFEYDYAD